MDEKADSESFVPDYGAFWLANGYDGVPQYFYDVPLNHLGAVRPGTYTSTVNLIVDKVEYAVTFDFKGPRLVDLAKTLPGEFRERFLAKVSALPFGKRLSLSPPIVVGILASLASPQNAPRELFIPLAVQEVHQTDAA
jgi:hypothetical protein